MVEMQAPDVRVALDADAVSEAAAGTGAHGHADYGDYTVIGYHRAKCNTCYTIVRGAHEAARMHQRRHHAAPVRYVALRCVALRAAPTNHHVAFAWLM